MTRDGIICIGRPIMDFYIRITEQNWQRISRQADLNDQPVRIIASLLIPVAEEVSISTGGVESNVAINSAVLGRPSLMVGAVGNDELLGLLRKHERDIPLFSTSLYQLDDFASGIVMVVEIEGDNAVIRKKYVEYGASNDLPVDFILSLEQEFRLCSAVFCSCFSLNSQKLKESVKTAISIVHQYGHEIVINMGGIDRIKGEDREDLIDWIRKSADVVSINRTECTVCQSVIKQDPSRMFPMADSVIFTDNVNGAILLHKGKSLKVMAEIVRSGDFVSDNGAGDAFLAAFLNVKDNSQSIEEIGAFAASVASIVVSQRESYLTDLHLKGIGGVGL